MSKILIFAGTTEGRELSEWLCEKGCAHDLCVATEYGEQVMHEDPLAKVHMGRMDAEQIAAFMEREGVRVVVDATHPYAKEATENIRQAAEKTGVTYLRLDRNQTKEETQINCNQLLTTLNKKNLHINIMIADINKTFEFNVIIINDINVNNIENVIPPISNNPSGPK